MNSKDGDLADGDSIRSSGKYIHIEDLTELWDLWRGVLVSAAVLTHARTAPCRRTQRLLYAEMERRAIQADTKVTKAYSCYKQKYTSVCLYFLSSGFMNSS